MNNNMKNIMTEWRKRILSESGLNRLHQHMSEHDCAIFTAYRGDANDMTRCADDAEAPQDGENNKTRNRDLKAHLLAIKVGVTKVDGSYIENFDTPDAIEVSEASLFCVNLKDESNFADTIVKLGEKYCQDSVLIIPMGGKGAYLVGTNQAEFPGLGETVKVGDAELGGEAEFMTKIRNKPFTFKEDQEFELEIYEDLSRNQRMAVKAIARTFLAEYKKIQHGQSNTSK
jgi:hypothetical protein